MIEIQGLSIFYGKRKLAYPDISVKKGEAVGIAGKSGCGKTSLFSFLLGELPDSAFSYEFEHSQGTKIRKNDIQKLVRRFVGFVNQQAGAFLLPGEFKKGTHFYVRFAE